MFLSFSIRNKELDKPISGNKGRLLGQGHSLASSSLTSLRSGPHLRINLEAQSFASCGTHSNGQMIAVVGIPNLLQAAMQKSGKNHWSAWSVTSRLCSWNLRLEPVILSRLSCLVEDKLQDLPQSQ